MNPGGSESIIVKLKSALPDTICPWVIGALRQDRVIWDKLQDPLFQSHALSQELSIWTSLAPATLALIAIHVELPTLTPANAKHLVDDLRADIQHLPDAALRKVAAEVYETLRGLRNEKSTYQRSATSGYSPLVKAGLLALVLRERRRKIGSWDGLNQELIAQVRSSGASLFHTWSTALACLYGMIPDHREMIQVLLSYGASEELVRLGAHAMLSNPLSPEKMAEETHGLIDQLAISDALPLLDHLFIQRPNLLMSLSGWIQKHAGSETADTMAAPYIIHQHPRKQVKELQGMLSHSEAQRLDKRTSSAVEILKDAWEYTQNLEAALAAELARSYSQCGKAEAALELWQKAVCLAPNSPFYRANLSMAFIDANRLDEARAWLPSDEFLQDKGGREHPEFVCTALAAARLAALSEDKDATRKSALGAIEYLFLHDSSILFHPEVISALRELSELLLELGLPVEAAHAAQALVDQRPSDPNLLALLGKAQFASSNTLEAARSLQIAASLAPENLELRRQLAFFLEAAGEWRTALNERVEIIYGAASKPSKALPGPDDRCALAKCALKAGEPETAANACRQVLAMESSDDFLDMQALAHLLLGQALEQLGDRQAAQEHYLNATQMVPNQAEAWLALAEAQASAGETYLALETLRSGAQAAPEAPGIYLALGEAYLGDWENHGHPSPTQALSMFRQAHDLLEKDGGFYHHPDWASKISHRLGETLYQLGHLKEAQIVLEPAYQMDPSFPGLAYIYARTLLDLGEPALAAPVLAFVVLMDHNSVNAHLDYASALLATKQQPKDAIASLRRVLELSPRHVQAQALLSEALAEDNQLTLALEAYQAALETDLIKDPQWCSRISLGLGRVALSLQQPDIAIAALQEASLADPKNPQIPCTLAEAYQAAGLLEDSLQTARIGLGLALEDLDVLIWFAEKAIDWIGKVGPDQKEIFQTAVSGDLAFQVRTEALNTLTRALQLAPHRTDLLIRLGRVQLQIEDPAAALETFHKVLTADIASVDDLHQAARGLLTLEDPQHAVACLEKAIQQTGYTKGEVFGKEEFAELAYTLVGAYQQAGNTQSALASLDQAILHYPQDVSLSSTKANLLLELGRPQEALASLEDAINLQPDGENAPDLHKRAANILRATGDLPAALAHIERILSAPNISPINPHHLWARILAADISRALLQPEKAWNYLSVPPILDKEIDNFSLRGQSDYREYFQMRAELALEAGKEVVAAESLAMAMDSANFDDLPVNEKVRLRAIEARLQLMRCQHHAAMHSFTQSCSYLDMYKQAAANTEFWRDQGSIINLNALVESSLELSQLDIGLALLEETSQKSPLEPLPHIQLARALVLSAEAQRLNQELGVFHHGPSKDALSEEALKKFEQAIRTANEQIYRWANKPSQAGSQSIEKPELAAATIARWNVRGLAAFLPGRETLEALSNLPSTHSNPDDVAALVAAMRTTAVLEGALEKSNPAKEIDLITEGVKAARNYPLHPPVLIQLALTLEADPDHLDEAYQAAHTALKNEFGEPEQDSSREPATTHALYPLYHALAARISYRTGDLPSALTSIIRALECWPDEAGWHVLAADVYRTAGDISSSIIHMEQAVELEPDYMPHYLKLGQSYLKQAQMVLPGGAAEASMNAIQILEKACELSPQTGDPWLSLARAHLCAAEPNSLTQAAECAERAINLNPNSTESLVLRAEIALQARDFQEAYDRALVASRLQELGRFSGDEASPIPQTDPFPTLLLIRALDGLGRTGDAIAAIDKALPQVWDRLPLLLERLQLISRSEEAESILASLQELAREYPDESIVLAPLAKALAAAGDTENAIRAAQRALQAVAFPAEDHRTSSLEVGEQAQLHLLLGQMLREAGQLDQAIHHLNEAIRQSPNSLEAYLELGRAFQDRRQHMQALQIYNQAMEVAPARSEPYFHAGLALKESKDYLGAESMLRKAVDLAPTDLTIHRQLGAVVALNLVHNRRKRTMEV
jgi:tetratricopeptide (TPR) repeat protein